jgi:hypothetical protein
VQPTVLQSSPVPNARDRHPSDVLELTLPGPCPPARRRIQVSAVNVNVSHGEAREDRPYDGLNAGILYQRRSFFLLFICGGIWR